MQPVAQDKPPAAATARLYTVVDGYKVDPNTMNGFRAWRAAACDRCHGANQEGLVGPSLLESLKTLSKEDFVKTVRDGRLDKGMVELRDQQDGHGQHRQPVRVPEGPVRTATSRARRSKS